MKWFEIFHSSCLLPLRRNPESCKMSTAHCIFLQLHLYKDCESMFKYIPKSVLPKEYGGDGCSVEELTGT